MDVALNLWLPQYAPRYLDGRETYRKPATLQPFHTANMDADSKAFPGTLRGSPRKESAPSVWYAPSAVYVRG